MYIITLASYFAITVFLGIDNIQASSKSMVDNEVFTEIPSNYIASLDGGLLILFFLSLGYGFWKFYGMRKRIMKEDNK